MEKFVTFRWKDSGAVVEYPEHYETHPVFGDMLERYTPGDDEYEEDKVVVSGHETPVDQRALTFATPLSELKAEELKDILRDRGLPLGGSKEELLARVEDDNAARNDLGEKPWSAEAPVDVNTDEETN